jgi:formamidopyrimidine-DNA glycosylase
MPELPDVEAYRRRLQRDGLRRRIERVRVRDAAVAREVGGRRLRRALQGARLVATGRRGKHLFARTSDDVTLVMHFGMTGVLEVHDSADEPHRHERFSLHYADGGEMTFVDPRRLGFVTVVDDVESYCREQDLGPDALSLGVADLRRLLRGYRGQVKALLMDQALLAGIGNVYSDEILFQARVDPRSGTHDLDDKAARRLHRQMLRVLRLAADRGADPARVPEGWLLRHREDGADCPRGNGRIEKIRVVGRGAFWCPACQR